ncbi:type IV toxin-antitoxin system AbiEi family antitoxin domain-containing protein [Marispirochaeta aestuarii]|uniref:type IV toxin-antitoxin system AbiEi family antitoxin domain-containing protein n=1 Tax=Marispirochaeta aestuarii TaxID=1963862 RepID=UPI0029C60AD5|nr:type IV toxin-antitoxin system AbiEi family antitoxin domain-containing protein [Marispirochaeta aestuarii]
MKKIPEEIFLQHGGQLRMSQAIKLGINRYTLYSLRDRGIIEQVSRGVYRLASLPDISNPDLVTVALRTPNAVICLVSALAYHNLTTQIPHSVFIALPHTVRAPRIDFPPISVHKFSDLAYKSGVEEHLIDGVLVNIYDKEKTLVDCFKFRNKLGLDIFLEALKLYTSQKNTNFTAIMHYAELCRVDRGIQPYLEALL